MKTYLKRVLATVIDIIEGLIFALIAYYIANLKELIDVSFLLYFMFCYLLTTISVIMITKRKSLGETFLKIRLIKRNNKEAGILMIIIRRSIFATVLVLAFYDPTIWIIGFLILTFPYNFKEWTNGLDFMFNTKYVEDKDIS